ncbi:MAG: site-2 protease family protein [Patescibacteria group bacterium]
MSGQPLEALASLLAIIIAITIHEFSHAFSSLLQGDSTAEIEGRVTLNPVSHVDIWGLLALIFLGFGWGKPVPFNPYNLKFKKWGPALVSLAGPFSNLLGVIIFGLALRLVLQFAHLPTDNLLITFLFLLVIFNIILMLFNLLPIPPLDGSKLLNLLPKQFDGLVQFFNKYGFVILIAIILFGQKYLGAIFGYIERGILSLIIPA